eukprot:scaffold115916_cov75-Phaeocystis_antarctica.AAC.1
MDVGVGVGVGVRVKARDVDVGVGARPCAHLRHTWPLRRTLHAAQPRVAQRHEVLGQKEPRRVAAVSVHDFGQRLQMVRLGAESRFMLVEGRAATAHVEGTAAQSARAQCAQRVQRVQWCVQCV